MAGDTDRGNRGEILNFAESCSCDKQIHITRGGCRKLLVLCLLVEV
jgi:hypothetical protein